MMYSRFLVAFVFVVSVMTPVLEARGQVVGRVEQTQSNSNAYFYHVLPGAMTVQVKVMGVVRAPGLYEVSQNTTLGQVLALSGGPLLGVLDGSEGRTVTIRLLRPGAQAAVYEASFDRSMTRPEEYPVLLDGDTVTVEVIETRGFNWRDIFTVTGGLAALALAVERVASL